MKNKIEKCSEGGEGIIVTITPPYLLPNDYSRCSFLQCPAKDCFRLQSYKYGVDNNHTMLVTDFSKGQKIENQEDCNYFI